jgi:predicted RND superfamily exporter protein
MIIAIDPGIVNFGLFWANSPDDPNMYLMSLNINHFEHRKSDMPFIKALDMMKSLPLPSDIECVIIETQKESNHKCVKIAVALYAHFHSRNINVVFSGTTCKNKLIEILAAENNILDKIIEKPTERSVKNYSKLCYAANKKNAVTVVRAEFNRRNMVFPDMGKLDDICDAYLLGVCYFRNLVKKRY